MTRLGSGHPFRVSVRGRGRMQHGTNRWSVSAWVLLGGVVAAVVGVALVVGTVQSRTASFGWFAYAPLPTMRRIFEGNDPGPGELFGYFLAAGGLLVLGWTAGHRFSSRSPHVLLPGLSGSAWSIVVALAGCASLLMMAGGAILLGSPPSFRLLAPLPASTETSVAYASSLELSFDDPNPEPLLLPGFGLLLGGLLVSATALGWRSGQPREADGPAPDDDIGPHEHPVSGDDGGPDRSAPFDEAGPEWIGPDDTPHDDAGPHQGPGPR